MKESMTGEITDPMMMKVAIEGQIKGESATMTQADLEQHVHYVRQSLVPVSPDTRGTCVDERRRIGTRDQEGLIEPRPSVPGGPVVYGNYIAELSGYFGSKDGTPKDRLQDVHDDLVSKKILPGGHDECAANAKFGAIVTLIAEQPDYVIGYAKQEMGDRFDKSVADEVIDFAGKVKDSKRYDDHSEDILGEVIGDDSGHAIEKLAGEHEGRSVVRNKRRGYTVDQTRLHDITLDETGAPEYSFVIDDWYADDIEKALATGPATVRMKQRMEHAREFVIAAVAAAVPNEELHALSVDI